MSDKQRIQIVPTNDGPLVQGFPGILNFKRGAKINGEVQVSLPLLGVSISLVVIKLQMSESFRIGGQEEVATLDTLKMIVLREYRPDMIEIYAGRYPFSINVVEDIPPTIPPGKHGFEIKYSLHATVYRGNRTRFWIEPPLSCTLPVEIRKYECHPAWPIYHNPEPRRIGGGGACLSAWLARTCYSLAGETINLMTEISFGSQDNTPSVLEFEVRLLRKIVTKVTPEPGQSKEASLTNLVSRHATFCTAVGNTATAELICRIPDKDTVPTLTYRSHIQVTYILEVSTVVHSQHLKLDFPIIISPFKSCFLSEKLLTIGPVSRLGGSLCSQLPSLSSLEKSEPTAVATKMTSIRSIGKKEILVSDAVIGVGGFSDVYPGEWVAGVRNCDGEGKLAVKVFRKINTRGNASEMLYTFQRRLFGEISTWLMAQPHPNILPFIGVYQQDPEKPPALVSPLREAGHILEYLSKNTFNRRPLALGIANGLAHLHAHNIIHGDLKPQNVLIRIDSEGNPTPEISDFGRAKILNVKGYTGSLHTTRRYTAPEVLLPAYRTPNCPTLEIQSLDSTNQVLTKASDVWSLGMVLLHVLSGIEPYPRAGTNDGVIMLNILLRGLEPKEQDHPDCVDREVIWPILRQCWKLSDEPEARCSAEHCAEMLNTVHLSEQTHV